MAFLPKDPLTLTGGCFCGACRYTISVPVLEERLIHPTALPTPVSTTESVQTRLPVVEIDHCQRCRRISGAIVQAWFVCPAAWVTWELQSSLSSAAAAAAASTATQDDNKWSTKDAVGPEPKDNENGYHLKRFQATDRATRSFCGKCGTTLSYYSHKRHGGPLAVVDITVGSLDQQSLELVRPERHAWWDSGIAWIRDLLTLGDGGFLIKHPEGDISRLVKAG